MSHSALVSYQASIDFKIPFEYFVFIASTNGGACKPEPIELENGFEVICDCLFGFGLQKELNFDFWQHELADDLPQSCMAIGSSPGGGFFLLLPRGTDCGVWFYDSGHSIPTSSELNNTYRCKISLSGLLALVNRPFNA